MGKPLRANRGDRAPHRISNDKCQISKSKLGIRHLKFEIGYSVRSGERTLGSETSQYQEEKKQICIPEVAASERGVAQTVRITWNVMRVIQTKQTLQTEQS